MFGFGTKIDSINVNEIDSLIGKSNIIDVREKYECDRGMLKSTKNIPLNTLTNNPDKYLKKEETYYIICHTGARSASACKHLVKLGYKTINVKGGMMSYRGNKTK